MAGKSGSCRNWNLKSDRPLLDFRAVTARKRRDGRHGVGAFPGNGGPDPVAARGLAPADGIGRRQNPQSERGRAA